MCVYLCVCVVCVCTCVCDYVLSHCCIITGNRGFSIGIGDVTPGKKLVAAKERLVEEGLVLIKLMAFTKLTLCIVVTCTNSAHSMIMVLQLCM